MTALLFINAFLRQKGLIGLLHKVCTFGCVKLRSSTSRLLVSSSDTFVVTLVWTSLLFWKGYTQELIQFVINTITNCDRFLAENR